MTEIQKKADKMAQDAGFDFANYIGKKGIFSVYCCDFNEGNEGCTGLPLFLLEHNGDIQFASTKETPILMDMLKD